MKNLQKGIDRLLCRNLSILGPSDWIRTSGLLNPIQAGNWNLSSIHTSENIAIPELFFLSENHKQKNLKIGAYLLLIIYFKRSARYPSSFL